MLEPARKKWRARELKRSVANELTPAQPLRASPSPHREASPVLFLCTDWYPSADASDLFSFSASKDEALDDSMSLAASNTEELSGYFHNLTPLPSKGAGVEVVST
ncbi:hypothetical protein Q8A67_007306 [Cirrhinus molitorella]|uniref:Uncharacterized protein n=1 Tax=Cirrhinus molitorella TaxID=172907 RepID=A0AA88Q3L3_9TELE|nr:hypothetical protein Q8A67_007306 [Cirrhinus molitorella]